MIRQKKFAAAGAIAAMLAAAMLLLAVILPSRYIGKVTQDLGFSLKQARNCVLQGDMAGAEQSIADMYSAFYGYLDKLKLIVHHDDIDGLEKGIKCSLDLVSMGQSDNLICELNELDRILSHIHALEHPEFFDVF